MDGTQPTGTVFDEIDPNAHGYNSAQLIEHWAKVQPDVYFFGNGKAEGNARMVDVLGGKGANLAEMVRIGVPVPHTTTSESPRNLAS